VIKELETLAETRVVHGNMDSVEIKCRFPEKIVFKAEGKEIGVIHGSGPPFKMVKAVAEKFSPKPDIIIFGHSHVPINEEKEGVLFFNPGSATDSTCSQGCSFGIIEINGDDVKAEIIRCD